MKRGGGGFLNSSRSTALRTGQVGGEHGVLEVLIKGGWGGDKFPFRLG